MRRALYVVHVTSLAGLWIDGVLVYVALPEALPVHVGLSGKPDGFAPRAWLRWLALPLVAPSAGPSPRSGGVRWKG